MTDPPVTADTVRRFREIVGPAHAITDPEAMAPFMREWRDRYVGAAAMVLQPGSTDQIARIMTLAHETKTPIVPQGGNTGLVGGQIPYESGQEVLLNLSRLNRIREVDTVGNVMLAEAGVILEEAQRAADRADRLFPMSLGAEGSCQIGGNIATNAGGTAVLTYGNMRELVMGLEVVLPDGRVWDGLRRLRKDNTGYDLKQLFIGSEGTLGIITAAVLRLFPKPREKATAFAGVESLEKAVRFFTLASEICGHALTTFELIPRIGLEFVLRHGEDTRDPLAESHPWYVLMEVTSGQRGAQVEDMAHSVLEEAFSAHLIEDAAPAASLSQGADYWRIRHLLSEVQKNEGGSIKHDVSVPTAKIPQFIERANDLMSIMIPGSRPVPFGHLGDGNIHYNVSQPPEMDTDVFLAQWDAVSAAVHEIVLDLDGSISAEHGVGRMKRALLPHVKSDVEIDMMRRIKHALDPDNICNPGKVI